MISTRKLFHAGKEYVVSVAEMSLPNAAPTEFTTGHRGDRDCDSWAEETPWHRAWKNKFPAECQEFIQHDGQSGERHIADVRTNHGLVIEFQRSHLDPQERATRERFYGNMIWVVDGTRLQRDCPAFS